MELTHLCFYLNKNIKTAEIKVGGTVFCTKLHDSIINNEGKVDMKWHIVTH